jgi:uncharacterized membrane protein YeiH
VPQQRCGGHGGREVITSRVIKARGIATRFALVDIDLLHVASLVAVAAVGVSGVLAAAERRLDLFGFAVVGAASALGGGTIRSVMVNQLPPWIDDWVYLTVAVMASWTTVAYLRLLRPRSTNFVRWVDYADACGLALFCITGASVGVELGYWGVIAVVLGLVTAVGGGVIRDLLVGRVPFIMRSEIYATAAILGASVYVGLLYIDAPPVVAGFAGGGLAFALRIAAIERGWSLPAFAVLGKADNSAPSED